MAKRKFDISTNNVETVDSDPFLNSDANTTVTTTNEERRADIRSWCPFCGATLQGLDAKACEVHLNVCLDCLEYEQQRQKLPKDNNADKQMMRSGLLLSSMPMTDVINQKNNATGTSKHCSSPFVTALASSRRQLKASKITDFFPRLKKPISRSLSVLTTSQSATLSLSSYASAASSSTTTTTTTTTTNNNNNNNNSNYAVSTTSSSSLSPLSVSRHEKQTSNSFSPFPKRRQSEPMLTQKVSINDTENVGNNLRCKSFTPPRRKRCPEYKRVPTVPFIVDDFAYVYDDPAEPVFFLSHFHADHYKGLNRYFNRGPIYCSQITANLLIHRLHIHPRYVHPLPMRIPTPIFFKNQFSSNSNNNNNNNTTVTVTLLDANHCPGSVLFVFTFADGTKHVHTGDFRFDKSLADHQYVAHLNITRLYLDTTYYLPDYSFPPQKEMIDKALQIMADNIQDESTLIVIGTYTIGKERLFLSAAQRFNCKIYVTATKLQVIKCLELPQDTLERFTGIPNEAKIHVVPMCYLSLPRLEYYLRKTSSRYRKLVAFRPTGWTFVNKEKIFCSVKNEANTVQIYDVPYSEHSSFTELRECVALWKPSWIIPTVNVSANATIQKLLRS